MALSNDYYQIGLSGTPGFNYVIKTDGAGGLKISRGIITGGVPVTTQDVLSIDALGKMSSSNGEFAQTGDFKMSMRTSARPGWVLADGNTIGNVGSGATNRANADCFDLFSAWWTEYSDAFLPIQTSAGSISTRAASALADWNAGKRLTVFDGRDRVARMVGANQGNGQKLAASLIAPAYTNGPLTVGIVPGGNQQALDVDGSGGAINATYGTFAVTASAAADLPAYRVRGASIGMPGYFKL